MKHIKLFDNYKPKSILLIVDVQRSFFKFFSELYINQLKKYCKKFTDVYQIFDNHVDGKNVDLDYLYDENPDIPVNGDLYNFPNQKDLIEKRYNYDVDADFYKKILSKEVYNTIKAREKKLKTGEYFTTTEGTIIVYIGNNHQWFHVPKKLYELFMDFKQAQSDGSGVITVVGGARNECLTDIEIAAQSLGVKIKIDYLYTYSATHCYF
jgi:hypothetical protein